MDEKSKKLMKFPKDFESAEFEANDSSGDQCGSGGRVKGEIF